MDAPSSPTRPKLTTHPSNMKRILLLTAALAGFRPFLSFAQSAQDYAVEVSATVDKSTPSIRLAWPSDTSATGWTIYRKTKSAWQWGNPVKTVTDTFYVDYNLSDGQAYEYQVVKTVRNNSYTGLGYIYAGVDLPVVEYRGKILLVFPASLKDTLGTQIQRLKMDMIGDGWQVIEIPLASTASTEDVRDFIKTAYGKDPKNTKSLFLLGHVPVIYSGNSAIDGHVPFHQGAWPADMIYGDIDGGYSDMFVDDSAADDPRNWNVPNDGKYDADILASLMELQVGRVDMFDLPAFKMSDNALLLRYLNKDHLWRTGGIQTQDRGLVLDNFQNGPEAFGSSGYNSFSAMFGSSNVFTLPYESTLNAQPYMWSYGAGAGWPSGASGIITTDQFAADSIQSVFTMLFGSWFGDWGQENNLLRAAIANKGPVLIDAWSGRPLWYFHHMAMGETTGYSAWVSQNNYTSYFKSIYLDSTSRLLSAALMGDPSLRMHIVAPVSNLKVTNNGNSKTDISWTASTDNTLIGYNIYRASSADSMFVKANTTPVTGTSFTDTKPLNGNNVYMVRALKLQQSASGTYYNMSTGVIDSAKINTGIRTENTPVLTLYPNPSNGVVNMRLPAAVNNGMLRVIDITGKQVFAERLTANANTLKTLDLKALNKGVYLIEIKSSDAVMRTRIVLQ
jgi:hypothetical protein